ncbi:MAG: hypothetical protein ACRCYX_04700 [Dermatophilaceae bacterium]
MPLVSDATRQGPTRRRLLAGFIGGATGTVAGCGLRFEDSPAGLRHTRRPVPGEDALVAVYADTHRLADLATRLSGSLGTELVRVHTRQLIVLRAALTSAGVPATRLESPTQLPTNSSSRSAVSAPATALPAPSASSAPPEQLRSPTPSETTVAAMADAEASTATAAARFPAVAPPLRAIVAALHAQRFAAAMTLTGVPPATGGGSVGGAVVRTLAGRTAAAIYLVEVAAARSATAQRARAEATLARLRSLSADHRALGADPSPVPGVPLPFPVRSTADAARLTRTALTALRDDHGRVLADLVTDSGGAGLAAATRWLGTVEADCHRWGAALEPFPGLR